MDMKGRRLRANFRRRRLVDIIITEEKKSHGLML